MSEPVRYDEVCNDWNGEYAGLAPTKDGEWVKYDDYARLKADVERLRKAGDAMVHLLNDEGYNTEADEYCITEVQAWNAAKEGKPSV